MKSFASFDDAAIAYRDEGEGRPALLLHGFLANAETNFVRPGVSAALLAAGRRVILPDLRGHGGSDASTDPHRWPPDVMAKDQEALLAHLGIADGEYDLVGYSLGARMAIRMLARGASPGRAALCGMGESATGGDARRAHFEDAIRNGENAHDARAGKFILGFMAQNGVKPEAALLALAAQIDTPPSVLGRISTPILCLSGADDHDNGSAEKLAAMFPNARAERTPGNHLSAVAAPEFAAALVRFLA
jgi:pimeloyl-ACP methyl ester carboxylesterase